MSANLFWFSEKQWSKSEPHLPTNQRGPQRHDDRRILSGIMHVQKVGCRNRERRHKTQYQEVKLTTGEKIKKLRLVARALVDNAIEGDTAAVRECFDRMDGKVTQSVDATAEVYTNVTFTWKPPS